MAQLIDLVLNNPQLIGLIGGTGGLCGIIGFLVRGVLRGGRSVLDERIKIAHERYMDALKTPGTADDEKARREKELLRTLRAALEGVDDARE
jgi:hypothetical protein